MVAQGARPVENACALGLGAFEQPGGGDVFKVEGRVLAHHHGRELAQRNRMADQFDVPLGVVGQEFEVHRLSADAVQCVPVKRGQLDGPHRVAGGLRRAHHGDA